MDLEVMRDDLATTRVVDPGTSDLDEGEVRLRVDRFALTTNNITYGVMGDALRYWDFFPPSSEGWGRIPAFGFAEVELSAHPGVTEGTRVFGYLPQSTELVVTPTRVDERGFVDGADHRREMAAAYNHYQSVDSDRSYEPDREDHQMLLRPLFVTSHLVEDFLFDNEGFGATTVLISSASSKTALGTAFSLRARGGGSVVGLTSPANRAFVEGLGVYDRVLTYDEVTDLAPAPTAYVDISGSGPLRQAVHGHLGDDVTYDMVVGATHWAEGGAAADLPGAPPEFFFAPQQLAKRSAEWGRDVYEDSLAQAWSAYVSWTDGWLEIERGAGADAVEGTFHQIRTGTVGPHRGHVLSMHELADGPLADAPPARR